MNYQEIFKKNPALFPSINTSFSLELPEMKTDKAIKLKYTKFYQLEYVGEIAERWDERKLVKGKADFIGLALGLAKSYSNDFLYNQKEIFINKAAAWLGNNFDLTSALSVLHFANEQNLDMNDSLESVYNGILESETKVKDANELVLAIHLAIKNKSYVHFQREESDDQKWRELICSLIDQLELNLVSPHEEYPLLALIGTFYDALDKPKAKEFKTKGMVRYLQSVSAMLYKEVSEDRRFTISDVLKISREDVVVYNYLLVFESGKFSHQDITEPGYERICERYVRHQFFSEKPVTDAFLSRLQEDKERSPNNQRFDFNFLITNLHRFANVDNLKKFLDISRGVLMDRIYSSHIILIQKDLVDEDKKINITTRLLLGDNYPVQRLNRENFEYLQERLEEYQANNDLKFRPNQNYVDLCIQYGHIDVNDVEKLKTMEVTSYAVEYVYRQKDWKQLIDLLEKINVIHHEVLWRYDYRLKDEIEGDLLKRYYHLYLNFLFYKEPSKYTKKIYELLNDESFVELFELSEEEIEKTEKTIYNHDLLPKQDAEELYRKYTPTEVLEEERLDKVMNDIRGYGSVWSLKRHFNDHLQDMKENEIVRKAFVDQLRLLHVESNFFDDFVVVFYKLKSHELITEEENQAIENKTIQAVRYVS